MKQSKQGAEWKQWGEVLAAPREDLGFQSV